MKINTSHAATPHPVQRLIPIAAYILMTIYSIGAGVTGSLVMRTEQAQCNANRARKIPSICGPDLSAVVGVIYAVVWPFYWTVSPREPHPEARS